MNLNAPLCAQAPEPKTRRDLDDMDFERVARGLIAFHPTVASIGPLLQRASREIPGLASQETVLRVYAHNPDSLFAISREASTVRAQLQPEGFIAQLPLNRAGEEALFSGELDTAAPDPRYLCRQSERPSAIYIWGIFINHRLAGGIALIMERLSSAKNRTAPLYCKATSRKSENFFLTLGFRPGVIWREKLLPELMQYQRSDETPELSPTGKLQHALYLTASKIRRSTCRMVRGLASQSFMASMICSRSYASAPPHTWPSRIARWRKNSMATISPPRTFSVTSASSPPAACVSVTSPNSQSWNASRSSPAFANRVLRST
jgi:hypothetical protein